MDQLLAQISERTGLTNDQAREVVQIVISYLKDKLPGPIAAQIDALMGTHSTGDGSQNILSNLGGLFGKS